MATKNLKILGGPIGTMTLTKVFQQGQWQYSVTAYIPGNGDTMVTGYPKAHIKGQGGSFVAFISPLTHQGGEVYDSGPRTSTSEPISAKVIAQFTEPEQDKEQNF